MRTKGVLGMSRGKFRGKLPWGALGAMLLLTVLFAAPDPGAGQQGIVVKFGPGILEDLEDQDEDGLSEYLILEVEVLVYESGTFGLHGSMAGGKVTANVGPLALSLGSHMLALKFSGGGISTNFQGGAADISLEVYSTDASITPVRRTYTTTASYAPADFEPPVDGPGTEVLFQGSEVLIEGEVMQFRINKTTPKLSFSYSGAAGRDTRATVSYREVIAFNDMDGNGRWDQGVDERRYSADLTRVSWKLDTDLSVGYDIALYGVIPLEMEGTGTASAWAKMTFRIRSGSLLLDGTAQKFDIEIELWQSLDADHLAVLHRLEDDSGKQTIVEGSRDGSMVSDPHVLSVLGGDGRTHGIYSWSDEITRGSLSPEVEDESVSSIALDSSGADISFSYPIGNGTRFVRHDPTVGMDPSNIPSVKEPLKFLENRPLLMLFGLLIGAAVVTGSFLMRTVFRDAGPPWKRAPRSRGGD